MIGTGRSPGKAAAMQQVDHLQLPAWRNFQRQDNAILHVAIESGAVECDVFESQVRSKSGMVRWLPRLMIPAARRQNEDDREKHTAGAAASDGRHLNQ